MSAIKIECKGHYCVGHFRTDIDKQLHRQLNKVITHASPNFLEIDQVVFDGKYSFVKVEIIENHGNFPRCLGRCEFY